MIEIIALFSICFLIYGTVMLIGLQALELGLAPKKATSTAAGFTGLFGYLHSSVASELVLLGLNAAMPTAGVRF